LLSAVAAVHKRLQRGGDHGNQYAGGKPGVAIPGDPGIAKSAEQTAKQLGVTRNRVEDVLTVLDHAKETGDAAVELVTTVTNSAT
jgi:hypothetical protein